MSISRRWVLVASGAQESGIKEESRVPISALGPRGRVGPRGERNPGILKCAREIEK